MGNKDKKAAPAATKEATKPAVEAVVEKKAEEKKAEFVTSTQLAAKIGIKGTTLRRWLRTLPQFQDSGYTRYKWDPSDPFLTEAIEQYKKHAEGETEKKAKRLEDAREKAAKKKTAEEKAPAGDAKSKAAKGKKAEPEPEPESEEDDDEFEDDEDGDEEEVD